MRMRIVGWVNTRTGLFEEFRDGEPRQTFSSLTAIRNEIPVKSTLTVIDTRHSGHRYMICRSYKWPNRAMDVVARNIISQDAAEAYALMRYAMEIAT